MLNRQMSDEAMRAILEVGKYFDKAVITMRNEFILDPKTNLFFSLNDVETELDFTCKMIEWLSRPACKGSTPKQQAYIRKGLNKFLKTEFTEEEMVLIYAELGGNTNRPLTIKFIKSGYNLNILKPVPAKTQASECKSFKCAYFNKNSCLVEGFKEDGENKELCPHLKRQCVRVECKHCRKLVGIKSSCQSMEDDAK